MKKKIILLSLSIIMMQISFANSIGIGYGVSDNIFKTDKKEKNILPLVDLEYEYKDFFIKSSGIQDWSVGYKLYEGENYKFTVYTLPFGGYTVKAGDMVSDYKGIDDRNTQFMGGSEFAYTFLPYEIDSVISFEYGKEGGTIGINLSKPLYITQNLSITPNINYDYYTHKFVDYYFGIKSDEINKSSNIKNTYKGKNAYKYGIGISANYKITENFSAIGFVEINKYSKEISNSPITRDNIIKTIGGGIIYLF